MKKRKIVSFCLTGGDIPEGSHCTLFFKPRGDLRDLYIGMLGNSVSFETICSLAGDLVECNVLQLEHPELYKGESLPHITTNVKEGGTPVMSNDLIAGTTESLQKPTEDCDFWETGIISAMYYNSEGKQYSTSAVDWE